MQDVPEWLEEVASGAVGSNYGPQGGSFASRDTRVSNNCNFIFQHCSCCLCHCSNNFVEVVVVAGAAAVDLATVTGLKMLVALEAEGALEAHHSAVPQRLPQTMKKNGIRT